MRILIIGASGMLGKALLSEAIARGMTVWGAARSGAEFYLDATRDNDLSILIDRLKPEVVINTAALTNISECQKNPAQAYLINAHFVGVLADICFKKRIWLVHISTDHYFSADRDKRHDEASPVVLVNEYARTKYAGECFALANPSALIIRTNVIGFRGRKDNPSFMEWVVQSLKEGLSMVLFDDSFVSSIHSRQFAVILYDLFEAQPRGLLNIASRDVFSKKLFVENIAERLGYQLSGAKTGSVFDFQGVMRAESLGLDVAKAESIIKRRLPDMQEVIDSAISEYSTLTQSYKQQVIGGIL